MACPFFHVQFEEKVIEMKKLFLALALLCFLIFPSFTLVAQDETGWPIEQRCVGDPTPPPEDWTFDGTILMQSALGIHVYQAGWETPHVAAFLNQDSNLRGAALSPDGYWYASPYGYVETTETYNTITAVDEIRIYSTVEGVQTYTVDWPTAFYGGTYGQIYWRDNQHLVYSLMVGGNTIVNPFTAEKDKWEFLDKLVEWYSDPNTYFSPDWTRVIIHNPYATSSRSQLYDIERRQHLKTLSLAQNPVIVWMPDSTHFLAESSISENQATPRRFQLFDQNGRSGEVVFNLPLQQQIGKLNAAWSIDGRYLAFISFQNDFSYLIDYDPQNTLYILDTQEHKIMNTCLAIGVGLAWSPDNRQIALLDNGDEQSAVMILNIESNQLYNVAYHTGSIIGWRAD